VEPWQYVKTMIEVGFENVEFVDFTPFKTSAITVGARFRAKKPARLASAPAPPSPAAVGS